MTETIVLKPDLQSVREAREFVALVVSAWGIADFSPRQIVSELVTNAVRASSEGQHIVVRAYQNAGRPFLEVWDQSDDKPDPRNPELHAESGRGLLLVSTLSKSWGIRSIPEGGKVVYVELAAFQSDLENTPW